MQILRGDRAQLRQNASRLILRESGLAPRCGSVFLGVFFPSFRAMMLVLGISADTLAVVTGASLGLLVTGVGTLFLFILLFDRATHIDRDRHSVRRGRRVARLQDFHAVGVEAGSHSRLDRTRSAVYQHQSPRATLPRMS